jgi:ribosomal protein S18 acetylase RimI-like enzyme
MGLTYFKRYRMEIDLADRDFSRVELPDDYRFVGWSPELLEAHAETKYLSFRSEIDASVFPCFGDRAGCSRLMVEITRKRGFLPEATWLVLYVGAGPRKHESCGTIQGIEDAGGFGAIQNLGVTPHHRHRGLGARLMQRALAGFQSVGLSRAYLEVTAQNDSAIALYQRLGFRKTRTLYKAVEVAYS